MPSLRERIEDIHLLFRKFASDFADRYHIPPIRLEEEAIELLNNYSWPGNIRQLKNVAEQISAVEQDRISVSKHSKKLYPKTKYHPFYSKTNKRKMTSQKEKYSTKFSLI